MNSWLRPPEQTAPVRLRRPRCPGGQKSSTPTSADARRTGGRTRRVVAAEHPAFLRCISQGPEGLQLKPYHLTTAMEPFAHPANNIKHDFHLGDEAGVHLGQSRGTDREGLAPRVLRNRPARRGRSPSCDPRDYATIDRRDPVPNFRDLIELNWESGMRPQEIRKIEARLFDAENSRISVSSTEGGQGAETRPDSSDLTPKAKEIVARAGEADPHGDRRLLNFTASQANGAMKEFWRLPVIPGAGP